MPGRITELSESQFVADLGAEIRRLRRALAASQAPTWAHDIFTAPATYQLSSIPYGINALADNGVTLSEGTDYTVDYSTGVITFTVARTSGHVIYVSYVTTGDLTALSGPVDVGPTFRQSKTVKFDGSATTYTPSLPSAVTAGDTLVALVAINDASAGITSVSGCGATWTKLDDITDAGQLIQASRFQLWIGTGATSGSTVTITLTNVFDGGAIIAAFGAAPTQIAHPTWTGSGGTATTAVVTPSATTTAAGEIVVGAFIFESAAARTVSSHTDSPEAWTTINESAIDPALTWVFGMSYLVASAVETTTRTTNMSGSGFYRSFAVVIG